MEHGHRHWLEKFQVQLASAAVLVVVYFGLWPLMRSGDPQGPIVFLATGSYEQAGVLVAVFLVLAAVCAALTVPGRPEGATIAVLIGLGALSLRSGHIRTLLWTNMDDLSRLYRSLILEVIMLAAALILAEGTIGLVRVMIAWIKPTWQWKSPLASQHAQQRQKPSGTSVGRAAFAEVLEGTAAWGLWGLYRRKADKGGSPASEGAGGRKSFLDACSYMALSLVISGALLLTLMRSADRGQILFALVTSFFLGSLLAHQKFPIPYSAAAWVVPIVLAVCFYALGSVSAIGRPPTGWLEVKYYAQALPIDWLTAGAGGAIIGFWMSSRIHEARYIERLEQKKGA